MPNDDLIVRVLAKIEREPWDWNQKDYYPVNDCGTGMCFAGWACALSGHTSDIWDINVPETADALLGVNGRHGERIEAVSAEGERYFAHLYHSSNTLDTLYAICARLMGIDEQVLRDKVKDQV